MNFVLAARVADGTQRFQLHELSAMMLTLWSRFYSLQENGIANKLMLSITGFHTENFPFRLATLSSGIDREDTA